MDHYNQPQKRKAEFFRPPNALKSKVGTGGLSEEILDRAQAMLESTIVDFLPLAETYLSRMLSAIEAAKRAPMQNEEEREQVVAEILYPVMQLKASGGMFRYPLVTSIAEQLVQFLEVVDYADPEVLEIVFAFYTTIRAVVLGRVSGDGGAHGQELQRALHAACLKYFEHKPQVAKK